MGKRLALRKGGCFGDLRVVREKTRAPGHGSIWNCICICGKMVDVPGGNLTSGNTKSCGCRRVRVSRAIHKRHGLSCSVEYRIWAAMVKRCTNPNAENYKYYGGRGINVCGKWRKSFERFLQDVGPRPSKGHQLERLNNHRGYKPGNVIWATRVIQGSNKRNNRKIKVGNVIKTIAEWAGVSGLSYQTIKDRLRRKWPYMEAVSAPPGYVLRTGTIRGSHF